jgi:hypothetical protein
VSISELTALRDKLGMPIEHGLHFKADKRLSTCAAAARRRGHIKA